MTIQYSKNFDRWDRTKIEFTVAQKKLLFKGFCALCAISSWIILTANANFISILAASIIAFAALYPSYLWCTDYVKGLPLFPLLALNYLLTHSFPLVSDNADVLKYSPLEHLISSLAVLVFLGAATISWTFYVQKSHDSPARLRKFSKRQIFPFFIIALIAGIIYQMATLSGYIWVVLPYPGVIAAIRSITHSLNSLAVIILGYSMGSKILNRLQTKIFILILAILVFVTGASLYLGTTGFYIVFACMGWILATKKIPWRLLLISILIVAFLHLGKGRTRIYYWKYRGAGVLPTEYTQVYKYWIRNSIEAIQKPTVNSELENNFEEEEKSILERSAVVNMLLKVQADTGKEKPYLWGETYSIIPQLLIPRFLDEDKIRGAEANHMLSIHYGLQSYRQTLKTSIGWGLLQEAYANYGWLGCLGLGVFIGNLYGWITRWSMNVSSLSFRFLVALIFMTLAFKGEITMGIFVAVIFKGFVILWLIRMLFMKKNSHNLAILKTKITQQSSVR